MKPSTTNTPRSCAAMRPLLSEFLDGGLPSETAWAVQKHITLCPDCARCAREMQATASLLAALPAQPLSANFDTMLSARIAAASAARAARAQTAWSPWRRLRAWLPPMQADPIFARPGQRAGLGAALAAFVIVAGFALNQTLTPTVIRVPAPSVTGNDRALIATCLTQHHATVSNEPLSDPSAQMLDGMIDASNAGSSASGQPQGLSEADAVALVNETD